MSALGSINLLPKSEFETSFWGKFLKWALSTGRYMVILTELVVIIAFLSRFKLDKDLADLSDNISGKKAVIDASASYEKQFRTIQNKLLVAEKMIDSQTGMAAIIDLITTRTVPGIKLSSVNVTKSEVLVSGTALSDQAFGDFITRVTASKKWKSVDLADITATNTQGIKFTIRAKI